MQVATNTVKLMVWALLVGGPCKKHDKTSGFPILNWLHSLMFVLKAIQGLYATV